MDKSFVNHLFLTSRFLVKGRVSTGDLRLTNFLNTYRRPLLKIEDITLTELASGDQILAPVGSVRLRDVLLAHEFLDLSGDLHRRQWAERETFDFEMASVYFRAPSGMELVGRVRSEVIEGTSRSDFFVVVEPQLRGLERHHPELDVLAKLPYVILNRTQVHCLFQYE